MSSCFNIFSQSEQKMRHFLLLRNIYFNRNNDFCVKSNELVIELNEFVF